MKRLDRQEGFTLIEVLVAVAILAVVATLLFASFRQSFGTTERVSLDAVPFDQARGVFEIVGKELSSTVWSAANAKSVFLGQEKTESARRLDELTFTTDAHARVVPDATETRRAQVTYFLDPSGPQGAYRLVHQEETNLLSETAGSIQAVALAEHVSEFHLEYYDGATWRQKWDAKAEFRIPRAVRVTVVFSAPGGSGVERAFTTIFTLPNVVLGG